MPPVPSIASPGFDRRRALALFAAFGLLALGACVTRRGDPGPEPLAIRAFAPGHGPVYTRVDLAGGAFKGATQVTFGGVQATRFVVPDGHTLYAAVPEGARTGPIEVTTPNGVVSSSAPFHVDSGPAMVSLFSMLPVSGPVGTRVTLRGAGLFSVTSVTFGGVPATLPEPLGDSERVVTVPAAAQDGPIIVALPDGTSASAPGEFRVQGRRLGAPVIQAYEPKSGPAGTSLEVDGDHFATASEVTIGGSEASFHTWSDTRMTVWVPLKAPHSGSLRVTSAWGSGTHPTPFTLVRPKPVIHALFPSAARPGTEITIMGDHLREVTAVRFGKARGEGLGVKSDTELRVTVPEGAASGFVSAEGPHGHGVSSQRFTVTATDPGLQVSIMGLYLTQATQRMDGSVPLVAGRDGLLRVFLLGDRPTQVSPVLEVTLKDAHGQVLLAEDVTAASRGLPLQLDEGNLARSWNLPVPGRLVQEGLRVRVQVLPTPGLPLLPEDRSLAPNVVTVPPLGLTLVPIVSGFGAGRVVDEGRSLASWVDFFQRTFPVGELDVELAQPFTTTLELGFSPRVDTLVKLRDTLDALRLMRDGGSRRYWYGVFKAPYYSGLAGLGNMPPSAESNLNRTALGWDRAGMRHGSNYPEVLAHEVGHLLNRSHAPCGSASGPDYHFPYSGGGIGTAGLDLQAQQAMDPSLYTDVMGYCSPQWISDFTYQGVLAWRLRQGSHRASGSLASRQPGKGLLIWGTAGPEGVTLEPAFETQGRSALPAPGAYRLECLDGDGQVLYELPFEPTLVPDVPEGEGARNSFVFAIPLTPRLEEGLASIQVRKGGVVVGTLRPGNPGSGGHPGARAYRDPVATVWGEGEVLVTWDPAAYPKLIVKDAATGQELAMADGGSVTLPTRASELDVILSDGLRTTTQRLQVRP